MAAGKRRGAAQLAALTPSDAVTVETSGDFLRPKLCTGTVVHIEGSRLVVSTKGVRRYLPPQVRAPHREVRDVPARPDYAGNHIRDETRAVLAVHHQVSALRRDPLDPAQLPDGSVLHRVAERSHDALDAP